ncbi:MAG: hypothetical protein IJ274_05325, partial [Lachnospiraceae bacterium]|nr:hypothetical protein [Lachnospiraceae bacterium]
MGKIIAFWSPFVGKAKVTSSMCAIAGIFGAEFPEYSIAITHIGSDCTDLGKKLKLNSARCKICNPNDRFSLSLPNRSSGYPIFSGQILHSFPLQQG